MSAVNIFGVVVIMMAMAIFWGMLRSVSDKKSFIIGLSVQGFLMLLIAWGIYLAQVDWTLSLVK